MASDRIEGNWKQITGRIKHQWGKRTDDDLDEAKDRRDHLIGKMQECYGIAKEEAREQATDEPLPSSRNGIARSAAIGKPPRSAGT